MANVQKFYNGKVVLWRGDCLAVLPTLPASSVDACVTDPPYGLNFMGKKWDRLGDHSANFTNLGQPHSSQKKFPMNKGRGRPIAETDGPTQQQWHTKWAHEVFRVLKPGAYLLAFGGTRTYHRMACAIEDAGFEIRDCIQWLYGSGFPKSHDVSKGIDRSAGVERKIIGRRIDGLSSWMLNQKIESRLHGGTGLGYADGSGKEYNVTAPSTAAAHQWSGWGTALKPACELIVLARKPLSENTVAANVLKWGTGALNIDACRIEHDEPCKPMAAQNIVHSIIGQSGRYEATTELKPNGRWPANVIHDGSEEAVVGFPETSSGSITRSETAPATIGKHGIYGIFSGAPDGTHFSGSKGSASRFFYTAKADADDRLRSKHPTVKPLDLLQYLVRLVTPPNGLVLDPFAGTGTTGEAALREGMRAVLIEREAEYQADIKRRMTLANVISKTERKNIAKSNPAKPAGLFDLF